MLKKMILALVILAALSASVFADGIVVYEITHDYSSPKMQPRDITVYTTVGNQYLSDIEGENVNVQVMLSGSGIEDVYKSGGYLDVDESAKVTSRIAIPVYETQKSAKHGHKYIDALVFVYREGEKIGTRYIPLFIEW